MNYLCTLFVKVTRLINQILIFKINKSLFLIKGSDSLCEFKDELTLQSRILN